MEDYQGPVRHLPLGSLPDTIDDSQNNDADPPAEVPAETAYDRLIRLRGWVPVTGNRGDIGILRTPPATPHESGEPLARPLSMH